MNRVNKHYLKGLKHGRLNVYNPGVLYGQDFKDYMAGFWRGQRGYSD